MRIRLAVAVLAALASGLEAQQVDTIPAKCVKWNWLNQCVATEITRPVPPVPLVRVDTVSVTHYDTVPGKACDCNKSTASAARRQARADSIARANRRTAPSNAAANPSGVTNRRTNSELRTSISKEGPAPPAVVQGPPGVSGTDCAGLPPINPPRTCPGSPGLSGPRARGFSWKPLVGWLSFAGVLGGIYCIAEPHACRVGRGGDNTNSNTNTNINGMSAVRGIGIVGSIRWP